MADRKSGKPEARPYSYSHTAPIPFQTGSGENGTLRDQTPPSSEKVAEAMEFLLTATSGHKTKE